MQPVPAAQLPIDHRCMTRVTPERVAAVSLELINSTAETWIHEAKILTADAAARWPAR